MCARQMCTLIWQSILKIIFSVYLKYNNDKYNSKILSYAEKNSNYLFIVSLFLNCYTFYTMCKFVKLTTAVKLEWPTLGLHLFLLGVVTFFQTKVPPENNFIHNCFHNLVHENNVRRKTFPHAEDDTVVSLFKPAEGICGSLSRVRLQLVKETGKHFQC